MSSYTYPRVVLNTYATNYRTSSSEAEDTTVLFAPFSAEYGPTNEITKIYSLDSFQSTFGELNYEKQGQTALNIANWLTNKGTVYAYRVFNEGTGVQSKEKAKGHFFIGYKKNENGNKKIVLATGITSENFLSNKPLFLGYNSAGVLQVTLETSDYFIESASFESGKTYFKENPDATEEGTFVLSEKLSISAEAKYFGSAYSNVKLTIRKFNKIAISLLVSLNDTQVESRQRISYSNISSIGDSSSYIGSISIEKETFDFITNTELFSNLNLTLSFQLNKNIENTNDDRTFEEAIKDFYSQNALLTLSNALETPIQIILDAGYSENIKEAMANLVSSSGETTRDDIIVILDSFIANKTTNEEFSGKKPVETAIFDNGTINFNDNGNLTIYSQCSLIEEGTYAKKDIWVTPTYFLSSLIPYNDNLYGIQYPTAGLTRGKISGIKAINENPGPASKQEYFSNRINYIEKDSRGYYFMSQRTHDRPESEGIESALSFLNNVRVKNKMVQELKRLGREYLFEFNDATTLSNMSSALNKYVNQWVQNRTLSYASVSVLADDYSNEEVNVVLNIKFTGTIEVINVDIVID